jgi:DNA-binding CsgD family transcriptional regulator
VTAPAACDLPRGPGPDGGDGRLFIRAVRLSRPDEPARYGVVFHSTGADFEPAWADFSHIFHLTASEHMVIGCLLAGQSADTVAAGHGISLETVRTHIRHIYAKLGVNSREQMFRRLAPFRIV